MTQNQIILNERRKPISLKPERILFYLKGEIIEAISEHQEVYYLFFYEYRFLTAVKGRRIKLRSYIEQAFKEGMVFEAPHPLINKLQSTHRDLQILSLQHLLNKLKLNYSPPEQAYILTLFESFFPKKQLFEAILAHYYEYRRNGQLTSAYQIFRILLDFAPKQSLVKSLANDVYFHKYAVMYKEAAPKILNADPIFAEKLFYAGREDEQYFQLLTAFLEQKSRWLDLLALFLSNHKLALSIDKYRYLTSLLEKHFNEEDSIFILEQLTEKYPSFLPIKHDLVNQYIKTNNTVKLLVLLCEQEIELSHSQLQILGNMLELHETEASLLEPELLKKILKKIMDLFPKKAEDLFKQAIISLLKTYELPFIMEWLKAFKQQAEALPIYAKIETMEKLSHSLDDMQTLGEFYFEFRQFNKAIECFSWEMELYPSETKPLQWLSKAYHELGQQQESEAYQQLCKNLQKWA